MKKLVKRGFSDENGGIFLKLKDGESTVGVFMGELFEFFQIWENGKPRNVEPDIPGAKSRFRLNFITKENGEYKAKIFEFGIIVHDLLAEIQEDYDLEKTGIKISRRGTGKDTTYMILPSKEQPSAASLKAIEAVPLNVLENKEPAQVKNYAPGADDEELNF